MLQFNETEKDFDEVTVFLTRNAFYSTALMNLENVFSLKDYLKNFEAVISKVSKIPFLTCR